METNKLKELSESYGLVGSDIHTQTYGQNTVYFMKKSGIDKIQAIEQIEIDFDPIEPLCVPGVNVAFKVLAKWGDKQPYRTVGESNKANTKVPYLACMAENRGRARAVLNLTGFAYEGVYSAEDKWEADELNHSK